MTRREWLARLAEPPMALLVWVGQMRERWRRAPLGAMRLMRLSADDVVVLEIEEALSSQRANEVDRVLQSQFPNHKVIVLHGGWKLSVVRPDAAIEPRRPAPREAVSDAAQPVRQGRYEAVVPAGPNPPPRRPSGEAASTPPSPPDTDNRDYR